MADTRRRYTKRQKTTAIVAALVTNTAAAAEQQGIPRSTIDYWLESEEFADLRTKTRKDIAADSFILAHLAMNALAKKIQANEVEPRDLATIYGIAVDKAQLTDGAATSRTETISSALTDHEKLALRQAIDGWLAKKITA